jgi:hypothetical protein
MMLQKPKILKKLVRINLIGRDFDSSQTYYLVATHWKQGK